MLANCCVLVPAFTEDVAVRSVTGMQQTVRWKTALDTTSASAV